MKKKRIRYSELTPAPKQGDKPARVSTPVELARALAAEREAARVARQEELPTTVASPATNVVTATQPPSDAPEHADLLVFIVGRERFAVPLEDVDEACDLPVIHYVPEMPPSMLGVISLRGRLVPVYSPSSALGQELLGRRAVLILRTSPRPVGILVDDVEDAIRASSRELQELAAQGPDAVVLGVLAREHHLISVMSVAGLASACRDTRTEARMVATA